MLVLCMVLCCSLDPVIIYTILFNKILNSHKNINLINILDPFDPFDPFDSKPCEYECVLCMVLCCSLDPVIIYTILFNKILNSHKNIYLINILDPFDPFDSKPCEYEC